MKKACFVATVIDFLSTFEKSDMDLLQSLGYEVHCASNLKNYTHPRYFQMVKDMGVTLHQIDFARNPLSKTNLGALKQLQALMEQEQFDIVHCHTPVGSVLGRLAAKRAKVPQVIYTVHGFHFFNGAPKKNWLIFYPIEKAMARKTDILITINNEDYERAKKHFHPKELRRIYGVGIELSRFADCNCDRGKKREELGIRENETLLVSVGELDDDKNHILGIQAMKTLAPKGYRWVIAGTGHLKEMLTDAIRENHLENAVTLLGFRDDIPELLRAADMYVFPSWFEGVSVALMEAVAAKLPIACTEVRGNVDTVVTKESYFSPRSVDSMVVAVERINALSPEEKERMVETNWQNLQKFSLDNVRKDMLEIYRAADRAAERGRK